jgi:hypothetical protein
MTSLIGAKRTSSDVQLESAFRVNADYMCSKRVFRILTDLGRRPYAVSAAPIAKAGKVDSAASQWNRCVRFPVRDELDWLKRVDLGDHYQLEAAVSRCL